MRKREFIATGHTCPFCLAEESVRLSNPEFVDEVTIVNDAVCSSCGAHFEAVFKLSDMFVSVSSADINEENMVFDAAVPLDESDTDVTHRIKQKLLKLEGGIVHTAKDHDFETDDCKRKSLSDKLDMMIEDTKFFRDLIGIKPEDGYTGDFLRRDK